MSDRPNQSESQSRLGHRIASYHAMRPSRLISVGTVAVCLIGMWVLVTAGWANGRTRWWLVMALAVCCTTSLAFQRRWSRRRIDLHQHGLRLIESGRYTIILWQHVREFYQSPRLHVAWSFLPTSQANWTCRILCRDGRVFRLAGYESLRGLGQRIQTEVTKRLLPSVFDLFRCGYHIRFGRRVAVSEEGMHVGFKFLAWHEIADVCIDETDVVRIALAGSGIRWLKIPSSQVANLSVLSQLLDSIRNAAARVDEPVSPTDDVGPDEGTTYSNELFGERSTRRYDEDPHALDDELPFDDARRTLEYRPRRPR